MGYIFLFYVLKIRSEIYNSLTEQVGVNGFSTLNIPFNLKHMISRQDQFTADDSS